ncbi:DNA polymerase III subunit beta [Microvirga sp. RSM25]|uniref:DNA polymerase III subunit beta n=1 Tax=Microvirga sp. RSM25 TaxID=3273802 RepID=UPI00384CA027
MDITLDRDQLLIALGVVQRIVPKKSPVPVLQNILLDAGPLTITGTDFDMMGSAVVEGQAGTSAQRITIPGHTLYDIVRKLPPGGAINASLKDEKGPLVIKCGRSRFTLQTLPAADFPDFSVGDMSHHFSISGQMLAKLISRCEFAMATDEQRHYLNGIYLHVVSGQDGPMLRLVATDGHRLARLEVPAPEGAEGMPGIIVPSYFTAELKRVAEAAGDIDVSLSSNKIRISNNKGIVLVSKLIDGNFPDYERVIPAGNDRTVVIERAGLEKAVDRVLTIAEAKAHAIKLAFANDRIEITHRNQNADSSAEEIDAAFDGQAMTVGFNGRYLLDILGAAGGERIIARLGDPGAPGIFLPEDDESALFVCMPMRV